MHSSSLPRFKGMTVKRMLSLAAGKELTEEEAADFCLL